MVIFGNGDGDNICVTITCVSVVALIPGQFQGGKKQMLFSLKNVGLTLKSRLK